MNLILSSTLFVLICTHENKQLPQCERPVIAMRAPRLISAKCLKVKVKCITEVKYDCTMSWRAYGVASFRICQVVGVRLYVTQRWNSVAAAPLVSICSTDGVTLSVVGGQNACPDHSYVWNSNSSETCISMRLHLTVTVTGCVFRLILNPELVNINQEDHYYNYTQVSLLLSGYWVTGSGHLLLSNDDLTTQDKEYTVKSCRRLKISLILCN